LNHFPTIGFSIAIGLFIGAIVSRSDDLKKASLTVLVAVAILTFPTYLSGNAADQAIRNMPDVSKTLIATHEGAALMSFILMEITGALAWLRSGRCGAWDRLDAHARNGVAALGDHDGPGHPPPPTLVARSVTSEIRLATESTILEGPHRSRRRGVGE
jgi:hypothetical protein